MSDPHTAPCSTFTFEQVMERSPSVEDQDTYFLDTAYTADEPQTLDEKFRFMSNVYACEQAGDALMEGVSSLGMACYTNS